MDSRSEPDARAPWADCAGQSAFVDPDLRAIAARDGTAAGWIAAFARFGTAAPAHVTGEFSVAVHDADGSVFLATDRFGRHPLCYTIEDGRLRHAERADALAGPAARIDPQALFDYLYFHVIPAPRTIFEGVFRLLPGHCACFRNGTLAVTPWWNPTFEEDRRVPLADLRKEFLALLQASVASQIDGQRVGCFLSGGTDSSTVSGMVGRISGLPARTFSIGFDAQGYDEMAYARIAARHFGTDHHEYYVTPDDLIASIPAIAAACDQPFGNSSIVPAYYCARLARDAGVERMLAGDGGDELFGGNTRYARQKLLALYDRVPLALRAHAIEPTLSLATRLRLPGTRRAGSYVEQARTPLPDRMQMHNLLTHVGMDEVLTGEFRAGIDPHEPMRAQRLWYDRCRADSSLNRILAYDWKYTLADNDIPKVVTAASLAGVAAGFPLLDRRLVDFSLALEPELKVRGLRLRWFFKEALQGFLPAEIIAKRKHGFGLPFGVWLTRHEGLRDFAVDALGTLRARGVIRPAFLDALVDRHLPTLPSYYGEMVWILMMYEHWQRAHASARATATAALRTREDSR